MPRAGDPYPRGNRSIRTLSNNPNRGENAGSKPLVRNAIEGKRSIRRLMKRDPAKGLELPSTDRMTDQKVGTGRGTDAVPSPSIVSKANKTPAPNSGARVIRPAGTTLKKR